MKKLNFIEMSTVYGGFDNDKCREVQKEVMNLIKSKMAELQFVIL